MPRTHKRRLGARHYLNYHEHQIEQALTAVADGRLSIRGASREFKVPYGTLRNKFHGKHGLKPGGKTVFSTEEEKAFVKGIQKCSDWGFPLGERDVKILVKNYLNSRGIQEPRFFNNTPGDDWVKLFLKRHNNELGQRMAANIKKARAGVTREIIEDYFNNLQETLQNVVPQNVFNYDETNVSDDPGKIKALFRKGVKYPERVINHSKSSTTVMICGSASGVLLPPYIIYKGEHLWNTWKVGGPRGAPCCSEPCCSAGARFARTKHGWIDAETFTDWFETCFLPHARRLDGKKLLLGDNLASHINIDVVKKCEENDILFVCFPPNSTHLLQPLDVAFFRPFKTAWRAILTSWKLSNPRNSVVQKEQFPALLKAALEKMDSAPSKQRDQQNINAIKRILVSGFEATGVYPLNAQRVLRKLPNGNLEEVEQIVNDTLTDLLRSQREAGPSNARPRQKRKKLQVKPGKSITAQSSSEESSIEMAESEESDAQQEFSSPEKDGTQQEIQSIGSDKKNEEMATELLKEDDVLEEGRYALIKFRGEKSAGSPYIYVCCITKIISENELEVQGFRSFVKMNKQKFRPVENDISLVSKLDLISTLPIPQKEGSIHRPEFIFPAFIHVNEY